MDQNKNEREVLKAWCSKCRGDRNCDVHGKFSEGADEGLYDWSRTWYLLTCRGCEHVFAQSVYTDSERIDHYYDQQLGREVVARNPIIDIWPAKAKRERPSWFDGETIDSTAGTYELGASLRELYGALDHDLNVLASIGIRTSFDIASEILGIASHEPFAKKIQGLVDKGHIKASEKDNIAILVDTGSASAHRGWKPSTSELDTLMEALEDFIYNCLVVPGRTKAKSAAMEKLKATVPRRQTTKKRERPPTAKG